MDCGGEFGRCDSRKEVCSKQGKPLERKPGGHQGASQWFDKAAAGVAGRGFESEDGLGIKMSNVVPQG